MSGPFPGMDPWLESPDYWRGFHNNLITYLTAELNGILPPGFSACTEERLYVVQPVHAMIPDLSVLHQVTRPQEVNRGGVAVRMESDAQGILCIYSEEVHEPFIEIRTSLVPKRVVSVIEILSPTNKMPGSVGREQYLNKQRAILDSPINQLEIDLLRSGLHSVAAPRDALLGEGIWDYLICLHRGNQRTTYEFWMNSVRSRLPRVHLPLSADVCDIVLDLQTAVDATYDAGPYRRDLDYSQAPQFHLSDEGAAWAKILLAETFAVND